MFPGSSVLPGRVGHAVQTDQRSRDKRRENTTAHSAAWRPRVCHMWAPSVCVCVVDGVSVLVFESHNTPSTGKVGTFSGGVDIWADPHKGLKRTV